MIDTRRLQLDDDQVVIGPGYDVRDRDGAHLGRVQRLLLSEERTRVAAVVVLPDGADGWPRLVPIERFTAPSPKPDVAEHHLEIAGPGWPEGYDRAAHLQGDSRGERTSSNFYRPVPNTALEHAFSLLLPAGFAGTDAATPVIEDTPPHMLNLRSGDHIEADHAEVGRVEAIVVRTGSGEVTDVLARHRRLFGTRLARIPASRVTGVHPGHLSIDANPRDLSEFDLVDR